MGSAKECNIFVGAPHTTFFEFCVQGHFFLSMLTGVKATKWFLLGKIYKRYGIVVDKTNKDSRWAAHSAVSKWLEEGDKNPKRLPNKICFSPEGWYTTGKMLLPFKTGAFKPGRPVQPYILKWDTEFNPTVTTYGQNISWFLAGMLTLAQPWVNVTIIGLPVYYPSQAEKHNPELYASNVAQLMSKKSGLPICKKSGIEYLDDIRRMKELHPEMDLIGWRGLFACSSELQASNLKKLHP